MTFLERIQDDLIFPVFVYEDEHAYNQSLNSGYMNNSKIFSKNLTNRVEELAKLKISNLLLFGIPKKRNSLGSEAFNKTGVIQRAIQTIKKTFDKKLNILSDVCICQYNITGHCGVTNGYVDTAKQQERGIRIDNDKTLNILGKISLSHCESGADFIAPSSMMDGQILYLSNLLDRNGFKKVKIMGYSAKQNSCLYSPFRNYNYLNPNFIDKSSYQSNFNNPRESIREILHDVQEGSDWVMIKPSLWYMDLVRLTKNLIDVPLVVQNVSGEYALLKAGSKIDPIDQREWIILYFKSLKRAGADKIISYLMLDLLDEFDKRLYQESEF
ncbi:porphobilinogen synthase [Candidatus Nitrosocosmicus arcticus]|uniref:porphobilinogen synthase n=1 Tax=Candidatus Nitrosocosmicus arcticus TaxID=2035267 RepID=UPI0016471DD6|nr:porphobilinogen synthase [Candidatus Nitrosocosmicus arcticus]